MTIRQRAISLGAAALLAGGAVASAQPPPASIRPNILWISSEDNGPHLGAYGDPVATTPELDRLAAKGLRFTKAWANAPVCAPSRTAIITGVLPTSTGGMHMRSEVPLPASIRMFPQLLREAGYYTTNNSKEDYNHPHTGTVWDESSARAHWRNRAGAQPFFAVFNLTTTHESQIRARPHTAVHDPARVRVPPYHPDAPEVRQDWAQYHDKMTEMDRRAGELLRELDAAGLADDTIVIYWGDHGVGLPRGKRWLYAEGLRVPLIVHVPERFRALAPDGYAPGAASDQLVTLMDLAPSMLSLAGLDAPRWMQGQAFMGPHRRPARTLAFAFRDRMDERYDLARAVTDGRFLYIRNYMPHRPQGQYLAYMFETPTTQVWKARFDAGTLTPIQAAFWQPKPAEELYDLTADRDNVTNLASNDAHAGTLDALRSALRTHVLTTRDLGLLPEVDMHARSAGLTPYVLGQDGRRYPVSRILEAADRASSGRAEDLGWLRERLNDRDAAVRYWATLGIALRGDAAVRGTEAALTSRLADPAPAPRIVAAEAVARAFDGSLRQRALDALLGDADVRQHGHHAAMLALNAIAALGEIAAPIRAAAAQLPGAGPEVVAREREYVTRLTRDLSAAVR
jgi:arylsulfatase A-like enzyme